MFWFKPLVAQVTSGLINVDSAIESKAMAIIADFVSQWKRRCAVEMRALPKFRRRYQKTMTIISDLFYAGDYKGEQDMNSHRNMTVKSPDMLKEIFLSICCDPSKGVKASDTRFKKITGTSDLGIPGPHMQDMITRDVRNEYDEFVQQRPISRDTMLPWVMNFKMFDRRLPVSVLEAFITKIGGQNNKMVSDLVNVMNDGKTSTDLIEEEEIKRFIADQVPQHSVFPVRNLVRPFGARTYPADPNLCEMFLPMRTLLFGAVPRCDPYEAQMRSEQHKKGHTRGKFSAYAFFPPVPSPSLTGIQQDFVWSCIAPVMFGAMYPWFTRPSDEIKQTLTKSFHAQMVLCSHGLSAVGERFLTTTVPVFMYICNMTRKFLTLKKNSAVQMRVDMSHKKPVMNGLRFVSGLETKKDDDGLFYWEHIKAKIDNLHDQWNPAEFSDAFETAPFSHGNDLVLRLFQNVEDFDIGTGLNIMEHMSFLSTFAAINANFTGDTQSIKMDLKKDFSFNSFADLLKNKGPGVVLHDGLRIRGDILPFQIHKVKDDIYVLTYCPDDKKGVACQTKKVAEFYRTLLNDRAKGNTGCGIHEHNIMRDHFDEPELYDSEASDTDDNDEDETFYMHGDEDFTGFSDAY